MTADVLPIQVQICRRFAFQSPSAFLEGRRNAFHKEHLSLTDTRATFKVSDAENHPEALNLNLSTVQSLARILHPPKKAPDTGNKGINHYGVLADCMIVFSPSLFHDSLKAECVGVGDIWW